MYQNLLAILRDSFHTLSKSQKAIASYLIEHYEKAAFMTAARLAHETGVSESTVVRFASEMGFDGYPALASYLQDTVYNRMTAVQRLSMINTMLGDHDVLERSLTADIDALNSTLASIDREVFRGAVDALCNAQNIYVIGVRNASPLALSFSYTLGQVLDNVKNITSAHNDGIFEQLIHIQENDVLLAFSLPRYSKRVIRAVDFAKKRNAAVVSITDSVYSPLLPLSDYCLLAKTAMSSLSSSLDTSMCVVNALLVAIGKKKESSILQKLEELETLWNTHGVYESN